MLKFNFLLLLVFILSCCTDSPKEFIQKFHDRCETIKTECQPNCIDKSFRACFVDTKQFPDGPYDAFKNCHAIHVGDLCTPCKQIFSLNFGGAMKSVSCEEFFNAIERKNKECANCLEQIGDSQFSY